MDGHVVLISPFYPEAGFSVGNAMARNKYIYCLADAAVVVHAGKKGGTLNGAEENLKQRWVPLWVKPTEDKDAANEQLVNKGGSWCAVDAQSLDVSALLTSPNQVGTDSAFLPTTDQQEDLFSHNIREPETEFQDSEKDERHTDYYQLFIGDLSRLATDPISIIDLSEKIGLHKLQVTEWLTRSLDDGHAKKLNRPVRYQYIKCEGKE